MSAKPEHRKRIRRDPETTRGLILDATEKLMVEEGYAAVSSRRIAQDLGLNGATVHYYYPTTDDVFIALHKRMTERQSARIEQVLASENPLKALWEFQSGWNQTALGVEFLALANHRKAIRDILAASTNDARAAATTAIERSLGELTLGSERVPSAAVGTILVAIGRLLANEERVGITAGHVEVRNLVEALMRQLTSSDTGTDGS